MARFTRTALIVGIATAAVVMAGWLVLRVLPETGFILHQLEKELREGTGQDLVVGCSRAAVSFSGLISVSVEGLAVRNPRNEPLFSAERVTLSPSLTALLRGELRIKSIHIRGFAFAIERGADGDFELPFARSGTSSPEETAGDKVEPSAKPGVAGPLDKGPRSEAAKHPVASGMKWSIEEVGFSGGRIDWVDRRVSPGAPVVIPLSDVQGSVQQTSADRRFSARLSGRAGFEEKGNRFQLEGSLFADAEQRNPARVQMLGSCESLELSVFKAYLPALGIETDKLRLSNFGVEFEWARGGTPSLGFKTTVKGDPLNGAGLEVRGDLIWDASSSIPQEIRWNARTGAWPLAVFERVLPPGFPIDCRKGVIEADLTGKWAGSEDWRLAGSILMHDSEPVPPFTAIGKNLEVDARFELEPSRLAVEKLEVSESSRLALFRCTVMHPFSDKPSVELTGECTLDARWLGQLDLRLPERLGVAGSIPVKALISGTRDDLNFDLSAGLTWTAIEFPPVFVKPRGKKGTISAKGSYGGPADKRIARGDIELVLSADMNGLRTGAAPDGRKLSELIVRLGGEASLAEKRIDFSRAVVSVKREGEQDALARAEATVLRFDSPDCEVEGHADVMVGQGLVSLTGLDNAAAFRLKGEAQAKGRFHGPLSLLRWSLELPLGPLDISAAKVFRKTAGVVGEIKAAGKWSERGMELDACDVDLPGLSVTGKGVLIDHKGRFGWIALDLRSADLEKLVTYSPASANTGLSGSVEGRFQVKPADTGIAVTGSLRPVNAAYWPRKAIWRLENLSGTIDVTGDSLSIPELTGTIAGFVQGGFKVKGTVRQASSLDTVNGRLSLTMGKGEIKADRLVKILNDSRGVIGRWLQPRPIAMENDFLKFGFITADFHLQSGSAVTNNLIMKGEEISTGFVGELRLIPVNLDGVLGIRTKVVGSDTLGKIPSVRQLMEDHRDLLLKIPVTAFARLKGSPMTAVEVIPVAERDLDRNVADRLKTLMK